MTKLWWKVRFVWAMCKRLGWFRWWFFDVAEEYLKNDDYDTSTDTDYAAYEELTYWVD